MQHIPKKGNNASHSSISNVCTWDVLHTWKHGPLVSISCAAWNLYCRTLEEKYFVGISGNIWNDTQSSLPSTSKKEDQTKSCQLYISAYYLLINSLSISNLVLCVMYVYTYQLGSLCISCFSLICAKQIVLQKMLTHSWKTTQNNLTHAPIQNYGSYSICTSFIQFLNNGETCKPNW